MAYALGIGQTDRRDQNGSAPSQASGLTTSSSNTASPLASNNQGLDKRVGTSQSAGLSNTAQTPGAVNSSSKNPDDFTKSNFANTSAIVDRNQGADQSGITNKITTDAQNQANGQIADVNKKGSDYLNNQTSRFNTQYSAATPDEINKVASGDQTATGRLNTLLYGAVANPDEFNAGTQAPIKANEYLKNGDITSVLMNRGSQDYTSGMGALDNLMFGRAGGFQQVGNKVQDLQSGVQNTVNAATNKESGYGAQAQKALDTAVTTGRNNTRSALDTASSAITNKAQAALDQKTAAQKAALQAQTATQRNQAGSTVTKQIQQLQELAKDPVSAPYANDAITKLYASMGLNPGAQLPTDFSGSEAFNPYIKTSGPSLDINDLLTQPDAQAVNRLQGLLGTGKTYQGDTGQGANHLGSSVYDEAAFNNYLKGIVDPATSQAATARDAANKAAAVEAERQAAAAKAEGDAAHAQAASNSVLTAPTNSGATQGPGNMDSTNAQAGVNQVGTGFDKQINWVGDKFADLFGW